MSSQCLWCRTPSRRDFCSPRCEAESAREEKRRWNALSPADQQRKIDRDAAVSTFIKLPLLCGFLTFIALLISLIPVAHSGAASPLWLVFNTLALTAIWALAARRFPAANFFWWTMAGMQVVMPLLMMGVMRS